MSTVVVYKDESGRLAGLGEKGSRAWAKFRRTVEDLEVGETLDFEWRKPRSPKLHRFFFGLLHRLFDMQEQFTDAEQFRAWLTVGAGYAEFVPGPKGRAVALPKSIAWSRMDDVEFGDLVIDVQKFLRTEHAQRFLWPTLDPDAAAQTIEDLFAEFER